MPLLGVKGGFLRKHNFYSNWLNKIALMLPMLLLKTFRKMDFHFSRVIVESWFVAVLRHTVASSSELFPDTAVCSNYAGMWLQKAFRRLAFLSHLTTATLSMWAVEASERIVNRHTAARAISIWSAVRGELNMGEAVIMKTAMSAI